MEDFFYAGGLPALLSRVHRAGYGWWVARLKSYFHASVLLALASQTRHGPHSPLKGVVEANSSVTTFDSFLLWIALQGISSLGSHSCSWCSLLHCTLSQPPRGRCDSQGGIDRTR